MYPADKTYFMDTTALAAIRERYPASEFPEVWDTLADLARRGRAQSPAQVLAELRDTADAELVEWAESNPALFHDLDDEQTALARQISKRHRKLLDDEAKSDSIAYVIALAAARRARDGKASKEWVAVTAGPLSSILETIDVCEDPAYDVAYKSYISMLRELDLKVPAPPGSRIDFLGIWKHLNITDEEIDAYFNERQESSSARSLHFD